MADAVMLDDPAIWVEACETIARAGGRVSPADESLAPVRAKGEGKTSVQIPALRDAVIVIRGSYHTLHAKAGRHAGCYPESARRDRR